MPNQLNLKTQGGISGGGGGFRGSQIQKSWEAVKRLDRLAPNVHVGGGGGGGLQSIGKLSKGWTDLHKMWYTSVDSSGNGHRLKTIRPTIPQGGILGGFMGSTIQKTGKFGQTAGPFGNQFCTYNADESGN